MPTYSDSDSTEKLILSLGANLRRSRPLRIGQLFFIGALILGVSAALGFFLSSLSSRNAFPGWWPEPVLILGWGLLSSLALSKASFPEEKRNWLLLAVTGPILWLGYVSFHFMQEWNTPHPEHIGPCPAFLALFGLIFGGVSSFWIRKTAPANPYVASVAVLSLLFAASNLTLKFICTDQSGYHLLLSHASGTASWIALALVPLKNKLRW
ncbi:DUF1109 domain-containing protein [Leptospira fletcheri]|uniref:DUF1109 domain-containing protein n=1 Tax=Leptospira fletcheri TaxID=2484981 RepID=A0A4R9GJH6_9LEPT|nr:NrsF family protein [Leptospira fletcheri]TGK13872.1 DUF1109 domain-containing protein [Leptospira fletcheri]